MIALRELDERSLGSPLGRVSPLAKLGVAGGWLAAMALTTDPLPPLALGAVALGAGLALGSLPPGRLVRGLAPLWIAALGIGVFNALFGVANADPAAATLVRLGPVRVTEPSAVAGVGLAARVLAIAAVGVVFGLTTDATRLVDALVQQARVPDRFAYGALAAYQAIPRLADDLATLRQSRRIRGLRGSWHPRLLVGLLVLAIRHADRLALAMDARGFGSGERSRYREVRWRREESAFLALGVALGVAVVGWL